MFTDRQHLATVVVATALLAGCSKAGMPTTATAARAQGFTAAGVERKFGYDWQSYQRDFAPKARFTKVMTRGARPASADLRADCPPVYDQGKLGSCTAFACAKGLREMLQKQEGTRIAPLSALFQYYETRASVPVLGWILVKQDCGGTISGATGVIAKQGATPEENWPYDIAKFAQKPPAIAYSTAGEFKFKATRQINGLEDVKNSLANGRAVAFGFKVYESFRKVGADGMMPIPAPGEQMLGGHAVLAVGYDDAKQVLIVRNSWSAKWGDEGYFYMPYRIAADSGTTMDFWSAD
jgi:C1A family cysteine protease